MKKKIGGTTFIEIIVALVLILIVVVPIMGYNKDLLSYDRKLTKIEEDKRLQKEIITLIQSKGFEKLEERMGRHSYVAVMDNDEIVFYSPGEVPESTANTYLGEVDVTLDEVKIGGKAIGMLAAKIEFKGEKKEYLEEMFISKYGKAKWIN